MTGRPATRAELAARTAKVVAFVAAVVTPMIFLGPQRVYMAALWLSAIATTTFPVVYCAVAPWWRYALGRSIFGSVASVAALIDFILWRFLTARADEWGIWLGAVLWASLAANITGLIRHLIRAQHDGKSRDLDGSEAAPPTSGTD